ncbi:MAG TPA: Sua5/YciO/YrdC/YwlC family protein [Planctomycetota bacterium]|nr:Sua5/YciO/YrdC/YwlC family protein [Planctomycetota bacterium]
MVETRIIRVDPLKYDPAELDPAVEALRNGGLVGMPTDTVYGVAADVDRPEAVARLREFRAAPGESAPTIHLGDRDDLRKLVPGPVPAPAQRLIQRFWPGPLTIVFPTKDGAGIAVRYPNHRVARDLVKRAGVRVGVPPAGDPPAVTGEEARLALEGKVDVLVDAGPTKQRGPSTVVLLRDGRAEVVHEGAIPRAVIDEVNVTTLLFVCTGNTCRSPMAEAMARKMLADRLHVKESDLPDRGYRVISAGTSAGHGGAASEESEQVVKKYGADLSRHESRPVTVAMIEEADKVWVMTTRHRKTLVEWMPDHAGKIELLDPSGKEVEDPIGGPMELYRTVAQHIHDSLTKRLKEIP